MSYDAKKVGRHLHGHRARMDMSQKEVSAAIGVNVNSVTNWERANSNLSFEHAWMLADVYGVSLDVLGGRQVADKAS